jgi:hypothetical protein
MDAAGLEKVRPVLEVFTYFTVFWKNPNRIVHHLAR